MPHFNSREEALAHKGEAHIAWLESNHWDTFYNKKRDFPNAEERLYDDLPETKAVLVRENYAPRIGGRPVKVKFLNNTKCLVTSTKSELQRRLYRFEDGMYLVTAYCCYKVEEFHYNERPKYPILTLTPIEDTHLRKCYNYVCMRVAQGKEIQYTTLF